MSTVERRRSRRGARGHRRGATVVLVVLIMSALLGVSALAIDFARLYTGINEMQTAADAAALHGALLVQKSPTSTAIAASVSDFAKTYNKALGDSVNNVIVTPYHFEATVNKRKVTAWGASDLNAVQVSVSRTSGLLMLGSLLNRVFPSPTRTSTAWVANFTGNTCVRPWAVEIGRLINRANPLLPVSTKRELTAAEMATLRSVAGGTRVVLAPPFTTLNQQDLNNYGATYYGGRWAALDPGPGSYNSAINSCSSAQVIAVGDVRNAANVNPDPASSTASRLAPQGQGTSSATFVCTVLTGDECWKDGALGGPVVMMFGYTTGSVPFATTDAPHTVALVGSFVLECFKQNNGGGGAGCSRSGAYGVSNWNQAPRGTMLGYVDFTPPTFSGRFSLGTGAGNGGATQQRLILVDPNNP